MSSLDRPVNGNHSNACDKASDGGKADIANNSSWLDYFASYIPAIISSNGEEYLKQQLERDSKHFMRGVMDECTHLANFSVPVDPELIVMVRAENDAYIPHNGYLKLSDLWPGSEVRLIPCGHVAAHVGSKYRKEFM